MILYKENPSDATRKLLEIINEFGTVAGNKIKTQKYAPFLYTNNENLEKVIKEAFLWTISKRIKYLAIILHKEAKYLYSETWWCWWKKSKTTQTDGKIYHALELEESNWQNHYTIHSNVQIQCNPYWIPYGSFDSTRTKKNFFLICMETQKIPNNQSNVEKEYSWRNKAKNVSKK